MRWGPGIESHINLQENVGLWRGSQLIRLAWRPQAPSITLDLTSAANGKDFVESYRTMLLPKPSTVKSSFLNLQFTMYWYYEIFPPS